MPRQLSVQQQNAKTVARIEQVASWFAQRPTPLPWLTEALRERDLSPDSGILVQFEAIPEQEGSYCKGVWVTPNLEFWRFEVLEPSQSHASVSIESFLDITGELSTSEHVPGIGKSFGFLALQVLERQYEG